MPCYDPGPTEDERRERFYKEFRHNSPLAEWLCLMFKRCPKTTADTLPKEAILWWIDHMERDANK